MIHHKSQDGLDENANKLIILKRPLNTNHTIITFNGHILYPVWINSSLSIKPIYFWVTNYNNKWTALKTLKTSEFILQDAPYEYFLNHGRQYELVQIGDTFVTISYFLSHGLIYDISNYLSN